MNPCSLGFFLYNDKSSTFYQFFIMDYSSFPNDPDHPAGSSPWQSPPHPTSRQSFAGSDPGSAPSSPLIRASRSGLDEYGSDHDTLKADSYRRDTESTSTLVENGASSEPAQISHHSNDQTQQPHQHQQTPYRQSRSQPNQQQRVQGPNRYHGTSRLVQRQNPPQYKLQAKITGLERTGRKDPVLRFDVHVCFKE